MDDTSAASAGLAGPGPEPRRPLALLVVPAALTIVCLAAVAGTWPMVAVVAPLLAAACWTRVTGSGPLRSARAALAAAGVGACCGLAAWGGTDVVALGLVAVVVVAFAARILRVELMTTDPPPLTDELSRVFAAAALFGFLGAHLVLVRATPRFGLDGLVVFVAAAAAPHLVEAAGRLRGPREGSFAGVLRAVGIVAAGAVAAGTGVIMEAPFSALAGGIVGILVGGLVLVGNAASQVWPGDQATKPLRFAGLEGVLVAAPFYYWTFRTLVV